MTVGAYTGVADRLLREFAEDPVLVRNVLQAEDLPGILTALAESFVITAEANAALQLARPSNAATPSPLMENGVEKREAALLEVMGFFDLYEVRGRNIDVRRHGATGLSVRYRRADGPADAA